MVSYIYRTPDKCRFGNPCGPGQCYPSYSVNRGRLSELIEAPSAPVAFVFREDGWFNMTKAAYHFGKQLSNFWIAAETKTYLDAVAATLEFKVAPVDLFKAVRGQGTWAHPKLAVFFARWLDVRFAVWCDAMIDDILKGNAEVTITAALGRSSPRCPLCWPTLNHHHQITGLLV
jgi:hypothetical protein